MGCGSRAATPAGRCVRHRCRWRRVGPRRRESRRGVRRPAVRSTRRWPPPPAVGRRLCARSRNRARRRPRGPRGIPRAPGRGRTFPRAGSNPRWAQPGTAPPARDSRARPQADRLLSVRGRRRTRFAPDRGRGTSEARCRALVVVVDETSMVTGDDRLRRAQERHVRHVRRFFPAPLSPKLRRALQEVPRCSGFNVAPSPGSRPECRRGGLSRSSPRCSRGVGGAAPPPRRRRPAAARRLGVKRQGLHPRLRMHKRARHAERLPGPPQRRRFALADLDVGTVEQAAEIRDGAARRHRLRGGPEPAHERSQLLAPREGQCQAR
jgi:hypothetical protein